MTFTKCEGGKCPSSHNCERAQAKYINGETIRAALFQRREPGASACDLYLPIKQDLSTFEEVAV